MKSPAGRVQWAITDLQHARELARIDRTLPAAESGPDCGSTLVALLRALAELAGKQQDALSRGAVDEASEIMAARERLLQQCRGADPPRTAVEREAVAQAWQRLRESDACLARELRQMMADTSAALATVRGARRVTRVYRGARSGQGRVVDREG